MKMLWLSYNYSLRILTIDDPEISQKLAFLGYSEGQDYRPYQKAVERSAYEKSKVFSEIAIYYESLEVHFPILAP